MEVEHFAHCGDEASMDCRCGNVAAILELDEHLNKSFKVSST